MPRRPPAEGPTEDPASSVGGATSRPLCQCGCGQLVPTPGARFCRGHNRRAGRDGWRTCLACGEPFWLKAEALRPESGNRRVCSWACRVALDRPRRYQCELQRRCLEYLQREQISVEELVKRAGVSDSLSQWFRGDAKSLKRANLAGLANLFGITVEQAIAEAGGTGEANSAAASRENVKRSPQPGTDAFREARRRAAETRRGKPRPPSIAAKAVATRRASGQMEQEAARLVTWSQSPRGRAVHSLSARLQRTPAPSRGALAEWAKTCADRLKISPDEVRAAWRPYLLARGIWQKGGRPALEARAQLMLALEAKWPRSPTGRPKRGFLEKFEEEVRKQEGRQAPDYAVLNDWRKNYLRKHSEYKSRLDEERKRRCTSPGA